MDTPWRIELLGGLRATSGDRVVSKFRSRNHAALLAYLAFYGDSAHPRETLIELLWPETDPKVGRNNLRVALSALRRQLKLPGTPSVPVILADRTTVRLNLDAFTTDVRAFKTALQSADQAVSPPERAQHLLEAVRLYRGELLPSDVNDWVLQERQRLAALYHRAMRQMSFIHEQIGDLHGALAWTRQVVSHDPLDEEAHRDLIRFLIRLDQRGAAVRHYQALERHLREEVGSEPAHGTRALVLEAEAAPDPDPSHLRGAIQNLQSEQGPFPRTQEMTRGLNRLATAARRQNDPTRERAFCEASLAFAREHGDEALIAAQHRNLGRVLLRQKEMDAAWHHFEESLVIRERLGDRPGIAQSLVGLATVARRRGDLAEARTFYERSLAIYESLDDTQNVATLLHYMGGLAVFQEDVSTACACYERSLAIWCELRSVVGLNRSLVGLMHAALLEKDPQVLDRALRLLASMGRPRG